MHFVLHRAGRTPALQVTLIGLVLAASPAGAQYPSGPGVRTADYSTTANRGGGAEWMNAYGDPVVMPASYGVPGGYGHGACPPGCVPPCYEDPSACGPCGDPCLHGNFGPDQCGPHYFDFSAEALFWERADTADPAVPIASLNPNGDIVLSTDDLSFDAEPGVRLMGRYDVGPVSFIEFGYFGLFEWGDNASAVSPGGNLFSPFTDFGTDPPFNPVNNPFDATEGATFVGIEYRNELHSAEISYRHYWVGYSPRVTGTLLAGARYTRLSEKFFYNTVAVEELNYLVETENDLVGFQGGGDIWVCLRQGIRLGATGKAGIYNNHTQQASTISVTPAPLPVLEEAESDHVSFLAEGNVSLVADVLPSLSLKVGYDVLFINTLALAPNNLNFDNNIFLDTPRTARLIEESSALYHGGHVGLEYVW